ncbi:MAG: L,D-transpeptidase family protein [Gemmatimonadaceae bacterium]
MMRLGYRVVIVPALVLATLGMTAFRADRVDGQSAVAKRPAAGLKLTAVLSEHRLDVTRGDSLLGTYDISIGKDEHPTPNGTFKIKKLIWNPRWVPPDAEWAKNKTAKAPGDKLNPMKVVKIFFKEPDYYIHGTADLNSLGGRASHGCLRMNPTEAAEVARWIMAHGGAPRPENWFLRVLHSRREEKVVYLRTPVSLTITK